MSGEPEAQNWWGIATPVNSDSSRSNSETFSNIGPVSTYAGPVQNQKVAPAPDKGANRVSIPVACVACRSKHLKCDGIVSSEALLNAQLLIYLGSNPCSRCTTERVACTYIKSRRGFKGPRRSKKGKPTFDFELQNLWRSSFIYPSVY